MSAALSKELREKHNVSSIYIYIYIDNSTYKIIISILIFFRSVLYLFVEMTKLPLFVVPTRAVKVRLFKFTVRNTLSTLNVLLVKRLTVLPSPLVSILLTLLSTSSRSTVTVKPNLIVRARRKPCKK